ncbi:MAG: metallophosphoesterase, partial [Alphaproteobacteria bacterium]
MAGDTIRLVQITDCHLTADGPAGEWPVDTDATLAAVIARVRAEAPDAVLATGDLSQDGSVESYRRIKALFERLAVPVHCLPGNHDVPATLAGTLAGEGIHVGRRLLHDDWQIVFLDSTVPGEDDGRLAAGELAALDAALAEHPDRHALVCLHHNPVAVGGAWRDVVTLENPGELFAVLDRHTQVRGV